VGLPRAAGMLLIIILTLIIILGIFPAGLMELVGASPIAF
jgi:Tfp pilus assembly protein PilX